MNFLLKSYEILTGKKSTAKEIAEVLVDLEIKELEFQAAFDASEEEVVKLNQARLSGVSVSSDDMAKVSRKLEAAGLDLRTIQKSKEGLGKRLGKAAGAELAGVQDKINALRPVFLKEKERIRKKLGEKLIEAQVLFNLLRDNAWGYEFLEASDCFFREFYSEGPEKPDDYLNLSAETKEKSKQAISGSVIGQMADLESLLRLQVIDQPEVIVERFLSAARNKAGVKVEQNAGAGIGNPSLN